MKRRKGEKGMKKLVNLGIRSPCRAGLVDVQYPVAFEELLVVAAGFSLRRHIPQARASV